MSIFQKIIDREIPAEIVYEDEAFIAFLDIKPIKPGHILVVPKKAAGYIFDMPDEDYAALMQAAKRLAPGLKAATGAERIGLAVEGFGVDHVHVHLVPLNEINELNPEKARPASPEELRTMAEKIKACL